ncbi:MAG: hypothetical protein WBN68_06185 [Sedimenticolaceae bacterium]
MMEIGLTKREVNRRRWLAYIDSWKRSGLTQKAFCQQHGLELASFRRWRAIAMREGGPAGSSVVSFLPVNVVEPGTANLSVVMNDSLRIEIPAGFDLATLRQVVQALQAP